jgi:hypothetical protein
LERKEPVDLERKEAVDLERKEAVELRGETVGLRNKTVASGEKKKL